MQPAFLDLPRATLEETLAFCNRVREFGGANPLDALMPAVPADSHGCLIARNLNFSCEVAPSWLHGVDREFAVEAGYYSTPGDTAWVMYVVDEAVRNKIADGMGLHLIKQDLGILLPPEIGRVAKAFDYATQRNLDFYHGAVMPLLCPALYAEMAPYIEASYGEMIGFDLQAAYDAAIANPGENPNA